MGFARPPGDVKADAQIDIIRDGDLFKAIITTDLDEEPAKKIAAELQRFCTDPDMAVLVVSSNVSVNWVDLS